MSQYCSCNLGIDLNLDTTKQFKNLDIVQDFQKVLVL